MLRTVRTGDHTMLVPVLHQLLQMMPHWSGQRATHPAGNGALHVHYPRTTRCIGGQKGGSVAIN